MSLREDLSEPFARDDIDFKPLSVSGSRCCIAWFIDSRCVMDRLDKVVGPGKTLTTCWRTATSSAVSPSA
jgi:hypothetical protein